MHSVMLRKDGDTAYITLDRPSKLNAVDTDVLLELLKHVKDAESDKNIRFVVISGEGKAFSAGADIKQMLTSKPKDARFRSRVAERITSMMESSKKVYIASVDGYCLGAGLELVLACDFRVCSKSSKFGFPEVKIGVTPGYGGTVRARRFSGDSFARMLVLTGEMIDPKTALDNKLVDEIAVSVDKHVDAFIKKMRGNGHNAISYAKRLFKKDLRKELSREREIFAKQFGTMEMKEGMIAFLEKRKPKW